MIKKLILKTCELTGLTPYDVVESFLCGAFTAVVLLLSIYPTFYVIMAIGKLLEL